MVMDTNKTYESATTCNNENETMTHIFGGRPEGPNGFITSWIFWHDLYITRCPCRCPMKENVCHLRLCLL